MYYLFIHKRKDLENYRNDFARVSENIQNGKTPVFSELRCAKTNMIESIPYNMISGFFLVLGTLLLNHIQMNETVKIALVLIVNSVCGCIANYLFTIIKHRLRINLCKRLQILPTEENIAVMESLEYQSV